MKKKECCEKVKKFKEWVKDNPKKAHGVGIGLGLAAAGAIGYKLGRK